MKLQLYQREHVFLPAHGFINITPPTNSSTLLPIDHCSFAGHPADCNVSTFRGESRGRLKRLNANPKPGSGGRRRTMFRVTPVMD